MNRARNILIFAAFAILIVVITGLAGNASAGEPLQGSPQQALVLAGGESTNPREFDLFIVNVDGSGLERVTYSGTFDAFPMFSPDGKKLSFSSNRNAAEPRDTNVFVADWVE